jgi:hypothetical protein
VNSGRSSVLRWLLGAAAALALAAALGWHEQRENQRFIELSHRLDEMRLLVQSRPGGNVDLHLAAPVADEALAEKVASRILANIPQKAPEPSARADEAGEDPTDPEARTAEQRALLARATELVDQSIRSGRLSRADVMTLRTAFSEVGAGPAQGELRSRIIRAINDQKLVPEDPAFILF